MSPKTGEMRLHNSGLSFLRIVDEVAINCQRGTPFVIVYISTASSGQHEFDAARRWVQTK